MRTHYLPGTMLGPYSMFHLTNRINQSTVSNLITKLQSGTLIDLFEAGPCSQGWDFKAEALPKRWKIAEYLIVLRNNISFWMACAYYRILSYIQTQNNLGRRRGGCCWGAGFWLHSRICAHDLSWWLTHFKLPSG